MIMFGVIAILPAMFGDLVIKWGGVLVFIPVVTWVVGRVVMLDTTDPAVASDEGGGDNSIGSRHSKANSSDIYNSFGGSQDDNNCTLLVLLEH